ncbi:MAG TPA: GNAT family N-acetyltransferase [Gemmatimonadaceae bacterium]|nr:GNAT family N-acetyltransferase [Gemmatimonadaceae bacterium]
MTAVTVHYLETDRAAFKPKHSSQPGVTFAHVNPPQPELNRFFYMTVGGPYYWLERREWTSAEWAARVGNADSVATWLLSVDGVPAGYAELERRDPGVVEIQYFGLLPHYAGKGLGAHMLSGAVERAFDMGAEKVIVNTCTLDHAGALSNYLARGFREVRSDTKDRVLPSAAPTETNGARALLRHAVAVVAYRGAKALRGAPASFAGFVVRPGSRTPLQILAHTSDLYDWALSMAKGAETWRNATPGSWDVEVARFHAALEAFDAYLAGNEQVHVHTERLFAGPIADSLNHIGQLTMLRRVAGAPIKGENYSRADILAGRLGPDQPAPTREFD